MREKACGGRFGWFWWPESVPTVTKPSASGAGRSYGAAGASPRPVISTPLKPPPPYWTLRPFQAVGRLTSNLIGGAFGSLGAIAPSTLQYCGVAGLIVPAGVGPRSATDNEAASTSVADSTVAASTTVPASAAHPVLASPRVSTPCDAQPASSVAVTSPRTFFIVSPPGQHGLSRNSKFKRPVRPCRTRLRDGMQ